jgi:hypothetical protein
MAVAVTAFFAAARHFSASARKYSARVCIGSKCKSGHSRIQIRTNPSELGHHHTPGTGRNRPLGSKTGQHPHPRY